MDVKAVRTSNFTVAFCCSKYWLHNGSENLGSFTLYSLFISSGGLKEPNFKRSQVRPWDSQEFSDFFSG